MNSDLPLDQLLDVLPLAVLVIDHQRRIQLANQQATQLLLCCPGELIDRYIRKADVEALQQLLLEAGKTGAGSRRVLQLDLPGGNKRVEVTASVVGPTQNRAIFLADVSEKIALGRQLKASRQPARKLLSQLHATTSSMVGYTELIDVMLDEESLVSGERLQVIRRYHKEVRKHLENVARLLRVERQGGPRPDAGAIPFRRKQVVVIDGEAAVTEFIAELMQALQYRVSPFTDSRTALAWCEQNSENIDLVIVDHAMSLNGEVRIAERLLSLPGAFPLVICSEATVPLAESERAFLCHKPIDINELAQIVDNLLENN